MSAKGLPEGITVIDTYEIEFIQTPERESAIQGFMQAHGVSEKDARLQVLLTEAYLRGAGRGYRAGYDDAEEACKTS